MTILITGANGQLGKELQDLLAFDGNHTILATDVEDLDITSGNSVNDFFANNTDIRWVINCAAFTAVDKAEEQTHLCRKINVDGPLNLAIAATRHGAKMIHISTDYEFEGEQQVLEATSGNCVILRTAWLYSPHGKNFVKTMLELGRTRDRLTVVVDQVGSPTYARDLAGAIITIINAPEWHAGIFHYSNEGAISWYDFTKAIHRLAGITGCDVQPCMSVDYPTPAHRPAYSVLDKTKIKRTYGITIPYWEESLAHCIKRLQNK